MKRKIVLLEDELKKLREKLETLTSKKVEEEEKNLKEINTIKQKADLRIAAAKVYFFTSTI